MMTIKYIYVLLLFILTYLPSFAQCTVPSGIPDKITVIESDKIVLAQNDVKYLSGGVILQVNDYQLKADSAIVFPDTDNFEAYGNVTLIKNNKKYITGSSAFYSSDAQYLSFMQNVFTYYDEQQATAKSSVTYNVSPTISQ